MSLNSEISIADLGVTVRCFTHIGSINGMGRVEIEAREFISLQSNQIEQFIGFQVTSGGEYGQTSSALIPYDATERLIAAIDCLSGIKPSYSKYKQIEAQFSIEPDFRLIVFNDAKGKLMFSVNAQSTAAFFGDLLRLSDLRSYIQKAKRTIDENRPSATEVPVI